MPLALLHFISFFSSATYVFFDKHKTCACLHSLAFPRSFLLHFCFFLFSFFPPFSLDRRRLSLVLKVHSKNERKSNAFYPTSSWQINSISDSFVYLIVVILKTIRLIAFAFIFQILFIFVFLCFLCSLLLYFLLDRR